MLPDQSQGTETKPLQHQHPHLTPTTPIFRSKTTDNHTSTNRGDPEQQKTETLHPLRSEDEVPHYRHSLNPSRPPTGFTNPGILQNFLHRTEVSNIPTYSRNPLSGSFYLHNRSNMLVSGEIITVTLPSRRVYCFGISSTSSTSFT
jgi:hypothetical protein